MYRPPNPRISPAPAYMPRQRIINIRVAGIRRLLQQRRARHNHPGLAITTLRNLRLQPSLLQRMRAIRRKPFNGANLALAHSRNPRSARAFRLAVNLHSASPAKSLPAPKFSPSKLKRIPQHPKQRSLRRNIHAQSFPINIQVVSSHARTSKEFPSSVPMPAILHAQAKSQHAVFSQPPPGQSCAGYKPPSFSDRRGAACCALRRPPRKINAPSNPRPPTYPSSRRCISLPLKSQI